MAGGLQNGRVSWSDCVRQRRVRVGSSRGTRCSGAPARAQLRGICQRPTKPARALGAMLASIGLRTWKTHGYSNLDSRPILRQTLATCLMLSPCSSPLIL